MADDDDGILDLEDGKLPGGVRLRLHKLATARDQARDEAAELREQIEQIKAQHAEQVQGFESQLAELAPFRDRVAELETAKSDWEAERVIVGAGITDPEGIEFARLAYGRIPEEERPKEGLAGWLAEDNREHLPRAVTAYLQTDDSKQQSRVPNADSGVRAESRAQRAATHRGSWADVRAERLADLGVSGVDVAALTGKK